MSWWTYINGTIQVSAPGRTQAECDYILRTVLDHLPRVTGSEGDMELYINNMRWETSCSHDEFENRTNNLVDRYGNKSRKRGWLNYSHRYVLTVQASLRDRVFEQTVREFTKWLTRLAKRMSVDDVFVKIDGFAQQLVINDTHKWSNMYEYASWCNDTGEPAWWEYLMWDRFDDTPIPLEHMVKYYNDDEADKVWFAKLEGYKR